MLAKVGGVSPEELRRLKRKIRRAEDKIWQAEDEKESIRFVLKKL
jgi:hypothetical protein